MVWDIEVDPLFHLLFDAALDVKTTFEPLQKLSGPLALIFGMGGVGFTVTKIELDEAGQLLESVNATE